MRQAAFDGKARRDEQGIDGVHNLMWANDSPHHRHDCPYSRRIIAETMAGVDPAHRERIVCGNARDLYQL